MFLRTISALGSPRCSQHETSRCVTLRNFANDIMPWSEMDFELGNDKDVVVRAFEEEER